MGGEELATVVAIKCPTIILPTTLHLSTTTMEAVMETPITQHLPTTGGGTKYFWELV